MKKSCSSAASVPAANHAQLIQPYQDPSNKEIVESNMLILIITLLLYLAIMVSYGFILQKRHADLFLFLYVVCILCTTVRNQFT